MLMCRTMTFVSDGGIQERLQTHATVQYATSTKQLCNINHTVMQRLQCGAPSTQLRVGNQPLNQILRIPNYVDTHDDKQTQCLNPVVTCLTVKHQTKPHTARQSEYTRQNHGEKNSSSLGAPRLTSFSIINRVVFTLIPKAVMTIREKGKLSLMVLYTNSYQLLLT